jgi:DNA replication initiation complex subunit (GINS family)
VVEETITFELIRKIHTEEQQGPKLSKIPENFFEAVNEYLQKKKQITLKDDRKVVLEIKNIERLVQDIYDRRERKIVTAAINSARVGIVPENMTEEEKRFFNFLVAEIKKRREERLQKIFSPEKETISMIIFKEDVPAFVGSDLRTYGPFKKGDIAKLPEENVKLLLEQKVAEEFKIPK